MARAPSSGGKTRLAPHLSAVRLASLRAALLADTLHALGDRDDTYVFFTPDESAGEMASLCAGAAAGRIHGSAPASVPRLVPQGTGDLGARMLGALRHLLEPRGYDAAILVGSDIPLLGGDHLHDAEETLRASGGVVVGPADDGGYYLIGMTQPHAGLFEGIAWGTESVLTDTLRAAERIGVEARLVRSAYDLDTFDDLLRVERDLAWAPGAACPELRRWLRSGAA
jgi:rSAM/selenodomain-associated transferase 1